jgi:hypothetical protein
MPKEGMRVSHFIILFWMVPAFRFIKYQANMRENVRFNEEIAYRVGLSSGICNCAAIGPKGAEAATVADLEREGYWMAGTAEKDAETGTSGAIVTL